MTHLMLQTANGFPRSPDYISITVISRYVCYRCNSTHLEVNIAVGIEGVVNPTECIIHVRNRVQDFDEDARLFHFFSAFFFVVFVFFSPLLLLFLYRCSCTSAHTHMHGTRGHKGLALSLYTPLLPLTSGNWGDGEGFSLSACEYFIVSVFERASVCVCVCVRASVCQRRTSLLLTSQNTPLRERAPFQTRL